MASCTSKRRRRRRKRSRRKEEEGASGIPSSALALADHNQHISILGRTTLAIPAETNNRQLRVKRFQEAANSSSVN
jgi:type VI protein secretion system component VasA